MGSRTTAGGSQRNSGAKGSDRPLKLLRFSFPYSAFIDDFYRRRPELAKAPFAEQDRELKGDYFSGFSDALTTALGPYGWETRDYAFSCDQSQTAWAREHGFEALGRNRRLQIAREQVLRCSPDVLFLNPYSVPGDWLRELLTDVPSVQAVVARHSAPKDDLSPFRSCSLVLSGDTGQIEDLRQAGINALLLHHAFDRRVLEVLPEREDVEDVILFTGNINLAKGFHPRRAALLKRLARGSAAIEARPLLAEGNSRRGLFRSATSTTQLDMTTLPPLFGRDMYRRMRETAATLNVHGDVSVGDANNIRLWEAPGVGTCLLTDLKANLPSLFEVDREVVAYGSDEECLEKAQWLLDNPAEREEIARKGQQRVLQEHTFEHRAPLLDEGLRAVLKDRADKGSL